MQHPNGQNESLGDNQPSIVVLSGRGELYARDVLEHLCEAIFVGVALSRHYVCSDLVGVRR
jgi:hypothetical protein